MFSDFANCSCVNPAFSLKARNLSPKICPISCDTIFTPYKTFYCNATFLSIVLTCDWNRDILALVTKIIIFIIVPQNQSFVNHHYRKEVEKLKNSEIRAAAKASGVYLYEVAVKLHISEPTMTRLMRNELDEKKKGELLEIIANVAAEKSAAQA